MKPKWRTEPPRPVDTATYGRNYDRIFRKGITPAPPVPDPRRIVLEWDGSGEYIDRSRP